MPRKQKPGTKTFEPQTKIDMMKARRAVAMQMYVEIGPGRSFAKLQPLIEARFGKVSVSALAQWSRNDKWVEAAKRHDASAEAQILLHAKQLVDVENINVPDGLRLIQKKLVHKVLFSTLTADETRAYVFSIVTALNAEKLARDPASPLNRGNTTHIEHMNVVVANAVREIPTAGAREALQLMERVKREVVPIETAFEEITNERAQQDTEPERATERSGHHTEPERARHAEHDTELDAESGTADDRGAASAASAACGSAGAGEEAAQRPERDCGAGEQAATADAGAPERQEGLGEHHAVGERADEQAQRGEIADGTAVKRTIAELLAETHRGATA